MGTLLSKLYRRALHLAFLIMRPMTLGARVIAFNEAGDVLLVRHTYVAGWHLPGGGVEAGETMKEAAYRELSEEGNVVINEPLKLFHIYYNDHASRRDHIAIFSCLDVTFKQVEGKQVEGKQVEGKQVEGKQIEGKSFEVAEARFFALNQLPETVTKNTRQRLAEFSGNASISDLWNNSDF